MKKSLFVVGDDVIDVTALVGQVQALNEDGEVAFSGNGLTIYRANHIRGNAVIFIKYVGCQLIFGETVHIYSTADKWTYDMYAKYKMVMEPGVLPVISVVDHILRKKFIIE